MARFVHAGKPVALPIMVCFLKNGEVVFGEGRFPKSLYSGEAVLEEGTAFIQTPHGDWEVTVDDCGHGYVSYFKARTPQQGGVKHSARW